MPEEESQRQLFHRARVRFPLQSIRINELEVNGSNCASQDTHSLGAHPRVRFALTLRRYQRWFKWTFSEDLTCGGAQY